MAKYFVTGGSGFLGINLIRRLLNDGHDVVSIDLEKFDYPERPKITEVLGDIRDYDTLKNSMNGADYVVHCAAALPLYSKEDIFSTDVDGTRNVLKAAEENNVKRTLFISSTAVYGVPDHHPLVESDKLVGVGYYGEAKILAEKECERYRSKNMIVPIIRPKTFVGPERLGVFAMLYDWAYSGKGFPMIGSGNNRYQLMDVDDLCDAIISTMVLDEKLVNDTFNIAAKEFTTMKEDFQAVLDEAGYNKKVIGFPASPVIIVLKILEKLGMSPLYQWVYETASKDSFVSIEKAEKKLGYKPKYSNKDALIRNYNWYVENLDNFQNEGSGLSHRVPWNQKLIGLFKIFF